VVAAPGVPVLNLIFILQSGIPQVVVDRAGLINRHYDHYI
jgi:hypothetical protein